MNGDGTVDTAHVQQVTDRWRQTCHVLVETVKHYHLDGQRVAMQRETVGQASPPILLVRGPPGCTSVAYNTATGQVQTIRYSPWGRLRSGYGPTGRQYTGQRWDGARTGLKTPCYIEGKAASSGLGTEFRTLEEFGTLLKRRPPEAPSKGALP